MGSMRRFSAGEALVGFVASLRMTNAWILFRRRTGFARDRGPFSRTVERVNLPQRLLCAVAWLAVLTASAADKPNVLFIAIDDQNDWIGALGGHSQAKTPHIDGLAKRGTLFSNAHCQAPLCNPSRSSVLTGLRPSSTGIYGLAPGIRDVEQTREHVTLPQTYTRAGYFTFTCGKIYHDGSFKQKDRAAEFSEWDAAPGSTRPAKPIAKLPEPRHPLMD